MHLKHSATRPPGGSQEESSRSSKPEPQQRGAAQEDSRAEPFDMGIYTKSSARKAEYDSVDEILAMYTERDDVDQTRAGSDSSNFDAGKVKTEISDNVEKMLGKGILKTEAFERLEARAAEHKRGRTKATGQERRRIETAEQAEKERRRAERRCRKAEEAERRRKSFKETELRQGLSEEGCKELAEKLERHRLQVAEAEASAVAEEEKRHPQRFLKENRGRERRGTKRNSSRPLGLIIGERRSWSREKEAGRKSDDVGHTTDEQRTTSGESRNVHKELYVTDTVERPDLEHEPRDQETAEMRGQRKEKKAEDRHMLQINVNQRWSPRRDVVDGALISRMIATELASYERDFELLHRRVIRLERKMNEEQREREKALSSQHVVHNVKTDAEGLPMSVGTRRADNPDRTHDQPYDPPIKGVSMMTVFAALCHIRSWISVYQALGQHYTLPMIFFAITVCIINDFHDLYCVQENLWYAKEPEPTAFTMTFRHMVTYTAWITLIPWLGPMCAGLMVLSLRAAEWIFSNSVEEDWWYSIFRPGNVHRSFLEKKTGGCQSLILMGFNIDLTEASLLSLWNWMLEVLGYVLTYIAFFSGDSWSSRTLALAVAFFIRSSFFPQLQTLEEGQAIL